MAEVFVSYNQNNRTLIEPIGAHLAALGVDVWYDREIDPAEGFGAALRARLRSAKVVVVCWSPEAVESEWVSGEAEYAIDIKNYVPVYIKPCLLMPPFNRIQTEDLSSWAESASDPAWLKLVERISKMIGREGIAAASRAYAAGNEKALYDFAQRYHEEPAAQRIWSGAEARHRSEFHSCLEGAQTDLAARTALIQADAAELKSCLDGQTAAFEAWIADERRGAAAKPRPDPLAIVRRFVSAEVKRLQDEAAALRSALAQAREAEEELGTKKEEIARLSEQSAEKSREVDKRLSSAAEEVRSSKAQLQTTLDRASDSANQLAAATEELKRLGDENASLREDSKKLIQATDLIEKLSRLKGADKIMGVPPAANASTRTKSPTLGHTSDYFKQSAAAMEELKRPGIDAPSISAKRTINWWTVTWPVATLLCVVFFFSAISSPQREGLLFICFVFLVAALYTFFRAKKRSTQRQ